MTQWQGKTRGNRFGYQFFLWILKYFGLRFTYFFLGFVVTYFVLFTRKERNAIVRYNRKILKRGALFSLFGVFRNYYKLGQVLIDKVVVLSGLPNRFSFDFDGEKYLHEMADAGEGGFLIGAHIGNWEIAGQLLDRIPVRVNIVMLDAEHEKIKSLLDAVIQRHDVHIIPIKEDLSHLIEIRNALDNNEFVTIHGDRFMEGTKTVALQIMGAKAALPSGPFLLASKYRKPVSFVVATKERGNRYHFTATPPKVYPASLNRKKRNEPPESLLNDYAHWLEDVIRTYPDQWFNYFDFWKF